jgi:hypothetical protein
VASELKKAGVSKSFRVLAQAPLTAAATAEETLDSALKDVLCSRVVF